MLILRRKAGESFLVGEHISITILDAEANGTVSIGIDAPRDVLILRSELQQAVSANLDSALNTQATQAMEALRSALSFGGTQTSPPESDRHS